MSESEYRRDLYQQVEQLTRERDKARDYADRRDRAESVALDRADRYREALERCRAILDKGHPTDYGAECWSVIDSALTDTQEDDPDVDGAGRLPESYRGREPINENPPGSPGSWLDTQEGE